MVWLPRTTYQETKEVLQTPSHPASRLGFSEFLDEKNILFFPQGESRIGVVEALVRTFPGLDHRELLTDLWGREREGSLIIAPDISILRARVEGVLHVQVAMGICPAGFTDPSNPNGVTRLVVLLVGSSDRLRIHLRFLVEISSMFRDKTLAKRLLRLRDSRQVLSTLRQTESMGFEPNALKRWFRNLTLSGLAS